MVFNICCNEVQEIELEGKEEMPWQEGKEDVRQCRKIENKIGSKISK